MGDRVVVRSVFDDDIPAIEAVMRSPGVHAWWWDFDIGEFAPHLAIPASARWSSSTTAASIGYTQYSEEVSLQYHFASIDLSIDDDHQGLGYGRDTVRALARYLFESRGHHRLTIDPALANERAIRCYEAVGFRRVGVIREYEHGADGTWHDGVLMELLADDLR